MNGYPSFADRYGAGQPQPSPAPQGAGGIDTDAPTPNPWSQQAQGQDSVSPWSKMLDPWALEASAKNPSAMDTSGKV